MARTATMSKTLACATADAKVINFWFSGQTETDDVVDTDDTFAGSAVTGRERKSPAPAGSGWSIWMVGDAACVATMTITIKPLNYNGKVKTAAGEVIFNAQAVAADEVYHDTLGSLNRCYGIQATIAEAAGAPAGNIDIEVVYETHD
jgi:hypothetical protein